MDEFKEITVVAKDRIGLLADVSEALSSKNINIDSISVESTNRTAIIRLVVQKTSEAKKALESLGMKVMDSGVLVIGMPNHPGELAKLSRILADQKMSIQSVFVLNKEGEQTVLALKVDNYSGAKRILREKRYL
ncbi:MAG: ACT domain-containing protein [Candidatus Micrarchaeota archaeon]